jgi:tetratricopeptide (TPR) repeat protein
VSRLVIAVAVVLAGPVAWAEDAASRRADQAYMSHISEGHELFTNGSHDAALRAYREALTERRDDAAATYFIACAQRALGQNDEALASFRRAAQLAGSDDEALHARALMNVALVQELRRDLVAAAEAWQVYVAYAETHQRVPTYVANARQRLEAIQRVQELDTTYDAVRQRIAEDRSDEPVNR